MGYCWMKSEFHGCCCTCRHQVDIVGHPWNEGRTKGGMSDIIGWGCAVPCLADRGDGRLTVIFSDRQHGMCELYDQKPPAAPRTMEG